MRGLSFWSRHCYSVSLWDPLVAKSIRGSFLMSMSVEDVSVEALGIRVWVLNDLGFLSLGVLRLWASRGSANWVRLGLHVRVKLDSEGPVVAEVLLSVSEVLVGSDDVTVKLWSEVVVDILGWVVPFGLGSLSSELELVGFHALGKLKRSVVVENVGVNAEVWNSVVDLVTEWLLLVLVLSAASG